MIRLTECMSQLEVLSIDQSRLIWYKDPENNEHKNNQPARFDIPELEGPECEADLLCESQNNCSSVGEACRL